jgi:peroxiredoxin
MANEPIAHPPETLEGWYALHQIFRFTRDVVSARELTLLAKAAGGVLQPGGRGRAKKKSTSNAEAGWTCFVQLIGSRSHLMAIHFRESLEAIAAAEGKMRTTRISAGAELSYTFLSVTEAGLYHITADLARAAAARGGQVGDAEYSRTLAGRTAAERDSDHVKRRLYPPEPVEMPYVCFYPMSKRRDADQNWYTLQLDERSRLMYGHGLTGRRYAGRVQQIITGAIGFDAWEWGVTLFAKDPLDFKKLVTDMRFDEVSAKYAEFGDFYVGKIISA